MYWIYSIFILKLFFDGKVWHQTPIFCTFCLSVYPYERMDRQTKSAVCVKCRSNSPVFKILFLLERYLTKYLYLINCFRLSVRFSVRDRSFVLNLRLKHISPGPPLMCAKGAFAQSLALQKWKNADLKYKLLFLFQNLPKISVLLFVL